MVGIEVNWNIIFVKEYVSIISIY